MVRQQFPNTRPQSPYSTTGTSPPPYEHDVEPPQRAWLRLGKHRRLLVREGWLWPDWCAVTVRLEWYDHALDSSLYSVPRTGQPGVVPEGARALLWRGPWLAIPTECLPYLRPEWLRAVRRLPTLAEIDVAGGCGR